MFKLNLVVTHAIVNHSLIQQFHWTEINKSIIRKWYTYNDIVSGNIGLSIHIVMKWTGNVYGQYLYNSANLFLLWSNKLLSRCISLLYRSDMNVDCKTLLHNNESFLLFNYAPFTWLDLLQQHGVIIKLKSAIYYDYLLKYDFLKQCYMVYKELYTVV